MLDEMEVLNIVGQELNSASGGNDNDSIDYNRQAALAAYLGDSEKVVEGRSSVVSTDVADAIEWIMPEIVKAFTQNNEVVTFDPQFEGDEKQAELESKYVYDILMKDNNGFLVLHQFIKDALMQKNGFIKVFYSSDEEVKTEHYTGLTEPEYNMIIASDEVEVIEETIDMVEDIPVFSIKVKRTISTSKLNVIAVPPEEFRVARMHRSVDLSDSRFTAHVTTKTRSDLIVEGFDKSLVESLPSDVPVDQDKDYRFYLQGETTQPEGGVSNDPSQETIEIAECYMKMDYNEDGISELVKVTVAGYDSPNKLLSIEEIDEIPFISSTAILMSHKLFGLSIYDRLIEIQNQKTSLWRNILDNMYLQNNQRTIVVENQVNLDDLMISRPGGIIRAKRADAVVPYPTPPLSSDSYKMMDYLDQVRAGRAGVSPEGAVTDNMVGDRVGSEGVEKMMNQKEELVGLMVRVIAETGIKPLCYMIRSQVIRHQDVVREYQFRGQWVKVDPRNWAKRSNTTVRVGTGSGNRKEQGALLGNLRIEQKELAAKPGQTLVTPQQEYALLNDLAKVGGFPSANPYFLDPQSEQGQNNAKTVSDNQQQAQQAEQQKEQIMLKAQADVAQAEVQKAAIAGENVKLKAQNDQQKNVLQLQKQQADGEIAFLRQQLEEAKAVGGVVSDDKDLEFRYWDREKYYETEELRIEESAKAAAANNQNKESSDG